jgi:hypothetical protein
MLYRNQASQKLGVFAYDSTTGAAKTGDALNITAYISLDFAAPAQTNDVNPTELDAVNAPGWYVFDLTQAETNAEVIVLAPVSATADILIDQVQVVTQDASISSRATQASVDALNDLDAVGVRTAVGLAAANLDTQIGTLATGAEVAAAEAAIRGADDDTLKTLSDEIDGVPAASWAYGTRTLTMTAAEIEAALSGDTITAHRGDSLSVSLAGLGSLAGYVSLDFTVKRSKSDSDDEAIIRIRKDASGVGDGLLRLNGAEAMAGDGSLVIDDEAAGNITVNLAASAMAELTAWSGYHYDVQMISATAVDTRMEGTFNVTADVTRAVV